MSPADAVHLLLAELRARRSEGVHSVELGPEAEVALRDLIRRAKGLPAAPTPSAGPAPRDSAPAAPVLVASPAAPPRAPKVDDSSVPPPPKVTFPDVGSKAERLAALRTLVEMCPECRRHCPPGAAPLLGIGSAEAEIVFVGEAPSEEDVKAGEPFVGPAGQILTKAITAMGLARESVYLTHVMAWRPETPTGFGNRAPTSREMAFCRPYLAAQLAILRPKVVVALGNSAVNGLFSLEGEAAFKVTQRRGTWLDLDGLPVLPTYHPSYLLRNPSPAVKRQFWEDLLSVMERLGLPISDRQRGFYLPKPTQRGDSE